MNVKDTNTIMLSGVIGSIILFTLSVSFIGAQNQGELNVIPRERVNLALTNVSAGITDTGLIFVNGTVLNNSTYNVEDVKVDVKLFSKDNSLINEESRFVTPPESVLRTESSQDFRLTVIAENARYYNLSSYGDRQFSN